ncbi:MAG: DHH family phosphoesterase [archaeon]|nr:hypothetical protein [archaeon]MDD2477400.1 hypothetical protein [Candidatus ainarchaeum sp.]MDD3084487.1 hypothetical protein [Candidatus ainarchaeum sp.]MDD4220768.1 hypothetical protein [Candidatus ainarchaeum sp.]MDD4662267.1 hypothetical protein [Candidatus ainarchaeum sp.]
MKSKDTHKLKSKKALIVAHRDADGITSAVSFAWNLLEKKKLPKNLENIYSVATFLDINYNEDVFKTFRDNSINLDDYCQLVILDFSFPIDILLKLKTLFKDNIIWIDHHKRADEDLDRLLSKRNIKIKGLRKSNHAACVLVWKFFKKGAPEFVEYIEDMDLWKWDKLNSKEFIAGLVNLNGKFTKETISYVFNLIDFNKFENKKKKIINRGKIIIQHQKNYVNTIRKIGKKVEFEGYPAYIINTYFESGLILEYLKELEEFKDIEIFIVWHKIYEFGWIKVSLRATKESKADLSLISKKYGGGGHPKASAFIIDDIKKIKIKKYKEKR